MSRNKTGAEAAARTLFVCVRDRDGKGASCAGRGARALLSDMRGMLAAEQIGADELMLRPCGCLGLCKQGPVMLAIPAAPAGSKAPPKGAKKRKGGVWKRVEPAETREILRDALLGPF